MQKNIVLTDILGSYYGEHIRNINNKKDTYAIEGINADLRHYIPVLARKSRCFSRNLETLKKVVEVFICEYNKFGLAKMEYKKDRKNKKNDSFPFSVIDFL